MAQLSLMTFQEERPSLSQVQGFLSNRRRQVYEALLELVNATSYELAGHLQLPIHVVMPRLTELKKADMVEVVGVSHLNNRAYDVYQVRGLST